MQLSYSYFEINYKLFLKLVSESSVKILHEIIVSANFNCRIVKEKVIKLYWNSLKCNLAILSLKLNSNRENSC